MKEKQFATLHFSVKLKNSCDLFSCFPKIKTRLLLLDVFISCCAQVFSSLNAISFEEEKKKHLILVVLFTRMKIIVKR